MRDVTSEKAAHPVLIGGTGRYAAAAGTGSFTGTRTAVLGGVVEAAFHLDLASS